MADDTTEPVTAAPPESPFQTLGTDHITIWGSNAEATIEYYRDLLGMSLVLRQPNLDDPSQEHLFFDTGDGTILTFFVSDDRQSNSRPQRSGVGGVHHLCFNIDPDRFEAVAEALEEAGRSYNVFDRGIFFSLYTRDHDGLIIELTADKFDIPDDRKGEVLAKTQEKRVADGAEYAKTEHLAAALDELGIEAEAYDLPDATSGVGGVN
ncbi:Catechol 2,3-dioxygenase [Halovenus aranensis]|uniref:Catechol 2,3-dioxygenase n=1 Tax=Halovenus aranensis TaxID=890420 RepID=A0A1G8WZE0_9EURY|nr:VOC family protein [Halovenus aranensis]SDJ83564.1 Catechol 2,3-dioxygenase [Halovenus aranensis]